MFSICCGGMQNVLTINYELFMLKYSNKPFLSCVILLGYGFILITELQGKEGEKTNIREWSM
jgi:hypothetical protein